MKKNRANLNSAQNKGKKSNKDLPQNEALNKRQKTKAKIASRWLRFRALLIDIFIIYVPILYLFYFTIGKEVLLNNAYITTLCTALFGLIQGAFLAIKAQSPGLKAYDLYLISTSTGQRLGFLQILWRYVVFVVSFGLVFGLFVSFLRKDKLSLHDILSKSRVVQKI